MLREGMDGERRWAVFARGSWVNLIHTSYTTSRSATHAFFEPDRDLCLGKAEPVTMDGYPAGSLDHNVPLLVASGLNSKVPELQLESKPKGILLKSELPPLNIKEADMLAQYFEEVDAQGSSWTSVSRDELFRFRIKAVGRVGISGEN